eukprot:14893-Heterococcus_DN1.PRE.4
MSAAFGSSSSSESDSFALLARYSDVVLLRQSSITSSQGGPGSAATVAVAVAIGSGSATCVCEAASRHHFSDAAAVQHVSACRRTGAPLTTVHKTGARSSSIARDGRCALAQTSASAADCQATDRQLVSLHCCS